MRAFFVIGLSFIVASVSAQYFQYSQYNFAAPRVNPAMVASSNYATLGLLYRNQSTGGGFGLNSNILSASHPILDHKTGRRWSGVGLTMMDDRAGGVFTTQEVSLSYAVNISLSKWQTLSVGFKELFQQRKVNFDGLFTGAQYIPDRGFDQSIFNGENMQYLKANFFTLSTGVYWQQVDKNDLRTAYWGVSLFDLNKPNESFLGSESPYHSTFVFSGGAQIYNVDRLSVTPEILWTSSAGLNVINAGTITSYTLSEKKGKPISRVDVISKYVFGRSGVFGVQFHKENFSVGFSYDFPVVKTNVANTAAIEVGVELRRLVQSKLKRKAEAAKKIAPKSPVKTPAAKPATVRSPVSSPAAKKDSTSNKVPAKNLQASLKHKQDSLMGTADAGRLKHEPLVLEKILLHFNFEFNSSELDDESKKYLNDLTEALKENEHLRVKLTGHTDNVGSANFNKKLSLYRANSIKDYLVEQGIDPGRIDTEGRGLHEPLNDNKTEEDRAKNRRVELLILYED